jgi:hypothetical protein
MTKPCPRLSSSVGRLRGFTISFRPLCSGRAGGAPECCGEGDVAHGGNFIPGGPLIACQGLGVCAAFDASDLARGVADAISWAMEEGWKGIPPAAIAKDLEGFAAVDYEPDALVVRCFLSDLYI